MAEINKISVAEAVNDRLDGKTSGTKLGAGIALITGCISLLVATGMATASNPNSGAIAVTASSVIVGALGALGYNKKKMIEK
jgi:hypothetical protein